MQHGRDFTQRYIQFVIVVLTKFVLAWMLFGCSPAVVHIVSADAAAFQEMLHSEMATDARRPAHLMGFSVRGRSSYKAGVLEDTRWPEPYTATVGPSIRPGEYHLAYAAQRLLREQYAATHPKYRALERNELAEIIDAAGGNLYVHEDFAADRVVDLVDVQGRSVFEIVPPGQAHQAAAKEKIDWLLRLINYGMIGQTPFHLGADFHGEIGVRFAEGAPPWKLTWATAEPGIVAYQWLALRVDKHNEDAYREAYLEHRWKPVTAQEIAKYGRALHEVVERLVQAREELGQTRAAREMPMLPGKTFADYLRSVVMWGAYDDKVARFLPVMRKPPEVRPDPRFVAAPPDGGASGAASAPKMHPGATTPDGIVLPPHPSVPEAYTLDGYPGKMPWQFFMGYSAHEAIAEHYRALHPVGTVYKNYISVARIVKETGGNEHVLHWSEADLRPDITHTFVRNEMQFVYEIKPPGDVHLAKGKEKLAHYITILNLGMVGTSKTFTPGPEYHGEIWITFKNGERLWRLLWEYSAPGILQYRWQRPDTHNDNQLPLPDRIREWWQALREGRARDLSEAEMAADAADLYEDVKGMMLRRDMLHQFRDGMTLPIEVVGTAMEAILSANLSRMMEGKRQVIPIFRKAAITVKPSRKAVPPAPLPKATPRVNAKPLGPDAPKSTPRVNSPSLGSDTVGKGSARPTPSPGKTPAKQPTQN